MKEYQPFAIQNFRSGFREDVEPWLLPRDAYQVMINANLYRGVLEKVKGYQLFADFTNRNIITLSPAADGVTKTFTATLPTAPVDSNFFGYGTIVQGSSAETFKYQSDASSTLINLIGSATGTGTVNLSTKLVTLNFNTAPPANAGANIYTSIFFMWDSAPSSATAIMGIKQYFGQNGAQDVLVFDRKRVGKIIINNSEVLASITDAPYAVTELPHDYYQSAIFTGDMAGTQTFTGTLAGHPFVPGTLVFTEYLPSSSGPPVIANGTPSGKNTVTDNGFGVLTGSNVASGKVNYVTGAYTVTFTVAPANGNFFDATVGIYGDLFSGSISDFFSLTNYQFKAFFCNNVDRIFYYDGVSVHYLLVVLAYKPITATSGVPDTSAVDITRCLHVFINQSRLLLISPFVQGVAEVSTIFWSTISQPLNFTNDESNTASTSEPIRAIGYINTDLIVRFATSERVFRYTNDSFAPFRWDSTNSLWDCDAPYSSINYDKYFTSVGRPAIVASNGVNVERADEQIPDFTDPTRLAQQTPVPYMNQNSIQQCYGERFDDLKEGWLCYNSVPTSQSVVTASDNVLAFNYLDSTYSIYEFPFSCLGFGRLIGVDTWGTINNIWSDMNVTWDSFQLNLNALLDLAGDQFDKVYALNQGNTYGDEETPILMSVITKNFNPFIEQGELCRFGYLDLLVSSDQNTTLRVQFFLNDELYVDGNGTIQGFYQETMLRFNYTDAMSPSMQQTKVWKRIYVGSVGKSHTIRFYQNADDFDDDSLDQPVYIHSMVPYMKPAGRIFN